MRDIGLTPGSATGWKKGAMPSEVNLRKLADYFGVAVEDLGEGEVGVEAVAVEAASGSGVSEFLSIIKSQQNTIETLSSTFATQTDTVATQSDTIASQHRLIEVMVVDSKKDLG